MVIGGHALPGQQQYPVIFEGAVCEAGLPEQPAHPMEGAVGGACDGQLAEQFLHTMTKTSDGDNFSELIDVTVKTKIVIYTERQKAHPSHLNKVACQYNIGRELQQCLKQELINTFSQTLLLFVNP